MGSRHGPPASGAHDRSGDDHRHGADGSRPRRSRRTKRASRARGDWRLGPRDYCHPLFRPGRIQRSAPKGSGAQNKRIERADTITRGSTHAGSCLRISFMNSDELTHNEVAETQLNGEHAVTPQASASPGTNRLLAYPHQSSDPAESQDKAAPKPPAKRTRIAASIMARVIIGGPGLCFPRRCGQTRLTVPNTGQ